MAHAPAATPVALAETIATLQADLARNRAAGVQAKHARYRAKKEAASGGFSPLACKAIVAVYDTVVGLQYRASASLRCPVASSQADLRDNTGCGGRFVFASAMSKTKRLEAHFCAVQRPHLEAHPVRHTAARSDKISPQESSHTGFPPPKHHLPKKSSQHRQPPKTMPPGTPPWYIIIIPQTGGYAVLARHINSHG